MGSMDWMFEINKHKELAPNILIHLSQKIILFHIVRPLYWSRNQQGDEGTLYEIYADFFGGGSNEGESISIHIFLCLSHSFDALNS